MAMERYAVVEAPAAMKGKVTYIYDFIVICSDISITQCAITECLGLGILSWYAEHIAYSSFNHILPSRCMWRFENLAKSYFPISLNLMGIVMRRAHVVLVTFPRVIDSNFV